MTLKPADFDSCEATRNMAPLIAALRAAKDGGKHLIAEWPQLDETSVRWHDESGLACSCGCRPEFFINFGVPKS
jgi:hypothetical protein